MRGPRFAAAFHHRRAGIRRNLPAAARAGFRDVFILLADLPNQRNLLKFLVVRTLYADAFIP